MSDEQRLRHLLDRARRGVILPAEGEQLVELVGGMEADLHRYEEVVGELNEANTGLQRDAANLQRDLNKQRWYAEDRLRTGRLQRQRAEQAEATVDRVRQAAAKDAPLERFMGEEPTDYARGWAAASALIDDALDQPQPPTTAIKEATR